MFPGRLFYIMISLVAAIDIVWMLVAHIGILPDSGLAAFLPIILPLILAQALRIVRDDIILTRPPAENGAAAIDLFDRAILLCQGLFFIRLCWIFLRILNHLTMTIRFPLADEGLMHVDQAMHLDWNAYFAVVARRPPLVHLCSIFYTALMPVSAMAFAGLVITNRIQAAEFFIAGFFLSSVTCILIGMFFPAKAAVIYMVKDQSLFDNFGGIPGAFHMPDLMALRRGGHIVLNLAGMPGLVSFPSFHTAAGIVMVGSYRRNPLFWPVLFYSAVMIATTPVSGGHYFIDLPGGAAVAFATLMGLERLPRYRGLFASEAASEPVAAPVDYSVKMP